MSRQYLKREPRVRQLTNHRPRQEILPNRIVDEWIAIDARNINIFKGHIDKLKMAKMKNFNLQ